jgi:hypothetical protein
MTKRRPDEPRLLGHSVADGANNGHDHRATHAAADQILEDAADIQSGRGAGRVGSSTPPSTAIKI